MRSTSIVRFLAATLLLSSCQCGADSASTGASDGASSGPFDDASSGGGADAGLGDGGAATLCAPGVIALSTPGTTLQLDGVSAPIVTFTVTASGLPVDAAGLRWTATRDDDASPGTVVAGVFTPDPRFGGAVTVRAEDTCGHSASAILHLELKVLLGAPTPAVKAQFAGAVVTATAQAPAIVYPSNDTRFPRNIYKQLFQWRTNGMKQFRLTFTGPGSTVELYTDGVHPLCAAATPAAGCWESDAKSWAFIASSNAGSTVDVILDGVKAGDASVYRSAKITIGFSRRDVSGAIFYWSTTAAGIRRASVSDDQPEAYVVAKPTATVLAGAGTVKCVACHTVSRSGKRMAGSTQASTSGLFVYEVTNTSPPRPLLTTQITQNKEFATFSPDDARLVATAAGALEEHDAVTGAKLAALPLGGLKATHPDWSPSDRELVFSTAAGDAPSGASLAVIAHTASGWGAVRTLAPASGATNLFPSFSPAGDWVAYSRGARGGHGDKTAQLHVIKADGTAAPLELKRANREVNNVVTDGQFENNQPTWAPPGDLHWVAFNSLRPFGVVYPTGGTQQIWVAAIDVSQAASGKDPSFPAFRFSFQDLAENNHRAYWVNDVRVTPDAGVSDAGRISAADAGVVDAGPCLTVGAACDQTSGPECCGTSVCDVPSTGGATICRPGIQ